MTPPRFFFHPFWDRVLHQNTIREYAIVLLVVAGLGIAARLYALVVGRRLRRSAERPRTPLGDCLIDLLDRAATPLVIVASLFVTTAILAVPPLVGAATRHLLIVLVAWYGITSLIRFLNAVFTDLRNREGAPLFDAGALNHVRLLTKIIVWTIGFLLVIRNLGYDITSLMAGVGVAGLAAALAVRNILGDIFSYVTILIDKPFEIGDFIVIGADMGRVEYIGIRSTRIRTLQGQELIVANTDLTSARIGNHRKMARRRVVCRIGIAHGAPPEKLRAVPGWIEEIMATIPGTRFVRAHLVALGANGLEFEIIYQVETEDSGEHMNIHQELNFRLYERWLAEDMKPA